MTAIDYIKGELTRLHGMLDRTLDDLSDAQIHAVPGGNPNVNTIAWILWHVVRTEDNVVRFVLQNRRPPVWTEGGYADKLGLPPVAQGTGQSAAEAQALRIKDVALWREYQSKVWASTDELLAKADQAFWDRNVTVKPLGDMPAWRALSQVCLSHVLMHAGQLETARTLVGAKPVIGV